MAHFDELKAKLGGLAVSTMIRGWMGTLDYQALFYDRSVDPATEGFRGPVVFVFWHEYIPFPVYLRPHCNVAMLVSRHRDAEWLSQGARLMGFRTVRGSTKRGGGAALRELFRTSRTMNLGITPDGPRGPRRHVAAGCVYLSSKLEVPLVPFGIGYHKPWRMPTWDRFAVPRPYSRARVVVGPRIQIPPGLTRDCIEYHQQRVERVLNRLTGEAEEWADSGQRRHAQIPCCWQPGPLRSRMATTQPSLLGDSVLPPVLPPTKKCA
jgi:lysophospholipid acyltransferase (LPLAT)-like uncharacterized protein